MALVVTLLAASSSFSAAASGKRNLSPQAKNLAFERSMRMGLKKSEGERLRKRQLNQKLLEKAVFVPPTNEEPTFMNEARRLADDAVADDDNYFGFGFDISQYSLKYTQCQAISTWSDELAEDEESQTVLKTQRFALFRLCPSDSCSANNEWGCSYQYGEYLIDMGVYLEAMQEFTQARAEAYCDFCEQCMANNGGRRRLADDDAAADDAAADDAAADDAAVADDAAGDDAAAADDAAGDDAAGAGCAYYNECVNYADTCEAEQDDAFVDYEDFFECQRFENNNGKEMYLGPHCASDGRSIIIGIYYDDMCTQYAGKNVNINSFTGMSFDQNALSAYFSDDCYSCKESVSNL